MTDGQGLDIRPGEEIVELPEGFDAGLLFIGTIRTPWLTRTACPRRGDPSGPICSIEVDAHWLAALGGLTPGQTLDVFYWMHLARRDLVRQRPRAASTSYGTFALRSPMRPNPIAVSSVQLMELAGATLMVRGLDCVDGTPLVDIKPGRCPVWLPV